MKKLKIIAFILCFGLSVFAQGNLEKWFKFATSGKYGSWYVDIGSAYEKNGKIHFKAKYEQIIPTIADCKTHEFIGVDRNGNEMKSEKAEEGTLVYQAIDAVCGKEQ